MKLLCNFLYPRFIFRRNLMSRQFLIFLCFANKAAANSPVSIGTCFIGVAMTLSFKCTKLQHYNKLYKSLSFNGSKNKRTPHIESEKEVWYGNLANDQVRLHSA